jgi:chromosome segregation ATPase
MSVTQSKYDKMKQKLSSWIDAADGMREKIETLTEENDAHMERASRHKQELEAARSDPNIAIDLEDEVKNLKKDLRNLKKEMSRNKEKTKEKIVSLEREIMRKDGKIENLDESRTELRETIRELKDDGKEMKRWEREREHRSGPWNSRGAKD